ncbi:MAG: NADH-quinone oxidoreductase subunit L [Pirellulaceae bacterium]
MDDRISLLLILVPALPLLAAVVTAALGPKVLKRFSYLPVVVSIAASFVCSLLLLVAVHRAQAPQWHDRSDVGTGYEHTVTLWRWARVHNAYELQGESPLLSSDAGNHDFTIDVTLRADALTAMMLTMVTFISSFVAIYSVGYMHGDRGFWRFFAYIGLFVFSMTMLVSVSNFLLLYVFWEAVGVCSYLLIGFWYEKPEAAAAGKKAFLVNRVGDVGFALALFLIWTTYGTLNFHDPVAPTDIAETVEMTAAEPSTGRAESSVVRGVLGQSRIADDAGFVGGGVGLAICLLLLLGACGKSAQFPLHVWLPDAMEGPSPVSALIHAATMVTAGVYMVARCTPLFVVSPLAQLIVACVGGFTALLAALIALTQFDLKRVLAYSTISQLGFMFLGLGAGTFAGVTAGMFHLFTHAFFKALLFLGAGSVMHAMGNVIDMRRFGGLRHRMPVTHVTFLIGCLALAGVPPLAGFWSKDVILASVEEKADELAHHAAHEPHGDVTAHGAASLDHDLTATFAVVYQLLYYAAVFTAFLTAIYTFRALYLTFYGAEKIPHEAGHHAHESPSVMTWPLIALAVGAGVAGFSLNHVFADFLGHAPSLAGGAIAATRTPYAFHWAVALSSSAVALGGVLVATYLYLGDSSQVQRLKAWFDFQGLSRWLDAETVIRLTQQPLIAATHRFATKLRLGWLASAIGYVMLLAIMVLMAPLLVGKFLTPYKLSLNKFFFDEIYCLAIVWPLQLLATVCYAVDRWLVDGLVNVLGQIPPAAGSLMRSLQMGLLQFYALAMVLGVLVLIATKLLWGIG